VNRLTIVDTDILIDAARQVSEAVECLAQHCSNSSDGVSG